jgi:hypothetical protein
MALSIIGQHDCHNFQQLKESNNDGINGGISVGTSKSYVGLYGKVCAQQSLPSTVSADTSGASQATAINSIITILKNIGIAK